MNKGGVNDDELTKGLKDKTRGLVSHDITLTPSKSIKPQILD
jgi:hypothetical protein